MKNSILLILLSAFLTSSLFAKADMDLVDEYLKVSGAGEIILDLPKQIERGYLRRLTDKNLKNIDIKSSFDSKKAMMYVRKKLSKEFSNELLKNVISYYKSEIGKKFKNSGFKKITKEDIKSIRKKPISYERVNIMNSFVERLELTPVAVHLIGELLGSINAELLLSNNREKVLQDISDRIRESMLENSLLAYSDFSDKELKTIIEYSYTNAGRFEQIIVSDLFKRLIMESFSQIMEQQDQRVARR